MARSVYSTSISSKQYEFHPFANLFPLMNESEFGGLTESILTIGQKDPIVLYDDLILDGRNRYNACQKAGIAPKYEEFKGNDAEALEFVRQKNLHRRNLTSSQRAAIAIKMDDFMAAFSEAAKERMEAGVSDPRQEIVQGRADDQVSEIMDTNREYLRRARKIKEELPEILEMVANGSINLSQAEEISKAEPEEQDKAIARIAGGAPAKAVVKNIVHPSRQGKKNGGKDTHNTPKHIIELAINVLGVIDLDPFSNLEGEPNVPAKVHFTIEDDGLKQPWRGKTVWMNPPFSDALPCNQKFIDHMAAGDGESGIVLNKLDSRPEWFELMMANADAFGIHKGYMRFGEAKDVAPFSVIYFYFGAEVDKFIEIFGAAAWCYPINTAEYCKEYASDAIAQNALGMSPIKQPQPIETSRFKLGDCVSIADSFKADVAASMGYPEKGTVGTIQKVGQLTCEVNWGKNHDPSIQAIPSNDLMLAKVPQRKIGEFRVGDRAKPKNPPLDKKMGGNHSQYIRYEVVKVNKSSLRVKGLAGRYGTFSIPPNKLTLAED